MKPSSSRERMLGAIRSALNVRGDEAGRRGEARARLERPPIGIIPARARQPHPQLVALFQSMLEGQGAIVQRLKSRVELPEAIAGLLRGQNLRLRLRSGEDPYFAAIPWQKAAPLERLKGPAQAADAVSLSRAVAAAAETGTMFFVSGPDNPSTLNFLPENHIAVISAQDITGSYEDAWAKLRQNYGRREMPRTVNWISGPSRTADIEQTIVRGAHGPKQLFVFIMAK